MVKKIIALLLCLAMVAGMTALVSAEDIVEVKPTVRTLDIAGKSYVNVFRNDWSFRRLSKEWGADVFTVQANDASAVGQFRLYYSYDGTTSSIDTTATYVFEWEWMAAADNSIQVVGGYPSGAGPITYNGEQVSPGSQKVNLTINLSAGQWKKEKLVVATPNASDYITFNFPVGSSAVSFKSFKTTVIPGDVTYDDIDCSVSSIAKGSIETMSVTGLKAGATVGTIANSRLSFESSDDGIISVDANGVLTANNYGTADITVTFADYGLSKTFKVTVPELKPAVRTLDIAGKSYASVIRDNWTFRGLKKTWGDEEFTVTPVAGSSNIDFRTYYSYDGTTASVDVNATYVYEWEWMAEDNIEIKLAGGYNPTGGITLNGNPLVGNWGKEPYETFSLSAGEWRTEKLVITKPHASDYWRVVFPDQQTDVSFRSFKTTVITGNETYDDISIGSIADIQVGKTATMSVIGLKAGEAVAKIANSRLSFASNNTEVVTVDANGVLTAKSTGTAKITVTFADYAVSKDIEVTVVPAIPSVEISANVVDAGAYNGFQHSYVVYAMITNFESIINYGMTLKLADGSEQHILPSGIADADVAKILEDTEGCFAFKVYGSALDYDVYTLTPYVTTLTATISGNTSKKFGKGEIEE